jgi:hypothetical protein
MPSAFFQALYRDATTGKLSIWDKASKGSVHVAPSEPDVDDLCGQTDLYFGVALRRDGLSEHQRGTVAECIALPGFFLDIDIQDGTGAHAAKNLPTRAQADELIALYPEPTMIVDSGHGLHAYWCFDAMAAVSSDLGAKSEAFQRKAIDYAKSKRWHVDQTGNLDRVLRVPMTFNSKIVNAPVPVLVTKADGPRYPSAKALLQAAGIHGVAQASASKTPRTSEPSAEETRPRAEGAAEQTIDEVKRRLAKIQNSDKRELLAKVFAGESFAQAGERDRTLQRIASSIAYVAPDRDAVELAREILGDSLKQMEDGGKYSEQENVDWAAEKIARAQEDARRDRAAKEKQNAGIASALLKRSLGQKTPDVPTIEIKDSEQERVVREAIDALRRLDAHDVAVRGGRLVRVLRDQGQPDWRERPEGTPFIAALPKPILRGLMERSANWKKWRKGTKATDPGEWVPAPVPDWAVEMVYAMGEWPLPQLEGISSIPVFSSDGAIQDSAGYDPKTRKIYDPEGTVFPKVLDRPTHADAQAALIELLEPFSDFPFVQPFHRAAVAAAILTVTARSCFDAAPAFPISAPKAGSGKSLIASAIFTLITGNKMICSPFTENVEEWRKRLLVLALENPAIWVIDNINAPFGNGLIDQVLTTGHFGDRLLGKNESASGTITSVWFPNGNNLQYQGDTVRRTVPINVDPELENPEYRSGFKHPDLIGYITQERPRLIKAALTILRAFVHAGMPKHGKAPKGSFEGWDRLIRGAVIWAGGADPEDATLAAREDGVDAEADNLGVLMAVWERVFGRNAVSINDALQRAIKPMPGLSPSGEAKDRVDLYEALKPYGTDKNGNFNPMLVPQRFKQIKGQVKGGKKLVVVKTISRVAQWAIVDTAPAQRTERSQEAMEGNEGANQAHDLKSGLDNIPDGSVAAVAVAQDGLIPHVPSVPHVLPGQAERSPSGKSELSPQAPTSVARALDARGETQYLDRSLTQWAHPGNGWVSVEVA